MGLIEVGGTRFSEEDLRVRTPSEREKFQATLLSGNRNPSVPVRNFVREMLEMKQGEPPDFARAAACFATAFVWTELQIGDPQTHLNRAIEDAIKLLPHTEDVERAMAEAEKLFQRYKDGERFPRKERARVKINSGDKDQIKLNVRPDVDKETLLKKTKHLERDQRFRNLMGKLYDLSSKHIQQLLKGGELSRTNLHAEGYSEEQIQQILRKAQTILNQCCLDITTSV